MNRLRKYILFALCFCLLLSTADYAHAAEIVASGSCDGGVTWTLYADQTLEFEGSGSVSRSEFSNYDVKKAVLGDGVTSIGQYAFSWMYLMTQIQLNEGLQVIDMYAFQGCTELPEITIPASVTSIGYQAFSQCPNLEKIVFLGSRPDINRHAFYNGDDTTHPITVYYPDDGTWQRSDMNWWNGVTTWIPYTMDANGQMVPDESRAYVVEEYIPQLLGEGNATDTITYKFYDCYSSLGIHSAVYEGTGPLDNTSVGRNADNIHIGEGITSIGDGVFASTSRLQSLYIPSTVTTIGKDNFVGGSNAKLILNEGLVEIGDTCFVSGAEFTLPTTVRVIGESAFNENNAAEIVIPEGVETLRGAFNWSNNLTKLILPEGLKELSGFKYCPVLEQVDIPSSVKQLGMYAFMGCPALKSVTIPAAVETIDSYAFGGCENLTEITYLGASPEIDMDAFGENPEYGDDYEWNLPPLTVYYPDDGSWTEEDMVYLHRTTTYIPYTVGANGERIIDESRAKVVEFVPLTSGTFASGGSWRIADDILYVGGCPNITPDENVDYGRHWAGIKGLVVEEGVAYFNCGFSSEHLTSATFSDSYYGGVTFDSCQALEKVSLGSKIVTIQDYFIFHCDNLKELVIPASVATFRRGSIYGEGLETVTFLGSAPTFAQERPISKGIGEITFYYPANDATWTEESMKALCRSTGTWIPYTLDANGQMVPDESQAKRFVGVVAIIDWSWDNIATLYSDGTARFLYGGSVSSIQEHRFPSEWQHVTHIEIDEGFTSINMTLEVTHDQPVTISLPSTLTTIDCLNVPNLKHLDLSHVTTIAPVNYDEWGNPWNVVLQCPNLESVVLSDQLTEIPTGAFRNTQLKNIEIPDSVTAIGPYAFAGTKLQSVVIPDSVTRLGGGAFMDCAELEHVQFSQNLTYMDGAVFQNCVKLTELDLPDSLQEVGVDIITGTSIRELIFPDGITSLGVTTNCPELVRVELPEGITVVGGFQNCPKLEEIVIPDSAADVCDYAFSMCPSLKTLDLKNVSYCYPDAFTNSSIEHLILGSNMETIPEMRFMCYDSLKSVVIPSGRIQSRAFWDCKNLESVTLGDKVDYVYDYAFQGCHKLTSVDLSGVRDISWDALSDIGPNGFGPEHVTFSKNQRDIGVFSHTLSNLKTLVIPEGVEKIGEKAFAHAYNLESVVLPDSLTEIGYQAFYLCKNLETVTFGKGLTTIWEEAFAYCEKLKEAIFRENLRDIGQGAFYDTGIEKLEFCDGVERIGYVPDLEYDPDIMSGPWSDYPTFGSCEKLKSVKLPEGLLYIPDHCFEGCESLESVVISDSVTQIGNNAFRYCDALKNVTFGAGLEEIGEEAFSGLKNLQSAIMQDNVYSIGYMAFYGCENLTEVRFSKNLNWMGDGAFAYSGIKEAILPDTFWNLAWEVSPNSSNSIGTFAYCTNLKKVVLPNHPNLHEIPASCFLGCVNLTEFQFPDCLLYLREYAFDGSGLTGAIILPNIREIGTRCFAATNLSQIIFTGYAPGTVNDNTFYCGFNGVTRYYPNQWRSKYLNMDYYSDGSWVAYDVDEKGEYIISKKMLTGDEINNRIAEARKRYPEGYPCDQYSVSVLNATDLQGYGSQAFAYIISDYIFEYFPSEVDTDVSFSEVKVGDILRLDKDSRAVVVIKKSSKDVTVVQGDWNGTVHWDEKLTKKQVEAADYRITRYGKKVLTDLSAVPNYKAQFPKLPTDVPTEQQAYERITAMASSFPENFPFNLEIRYATRGDTTAANLPDQGTACSAFVYMAGDIAFGTAPFRVNNEIKYEDIMVGDVLHFDPDPNDKTTHVVVVWKIYEDYLVTVEGNYGNTVHWGGTFTKSEVENMLEHWTRYPEGTVPGPRAEAPKPINTLKTKLSHSGDSATGKPVLKWEPVDGAVKYNVWRCTSKNGYYELIATVMGLEYTDFSAVAGKKYYYKVTGEAGGIQSRDSDSVCRYCDLPRPVVEESNDSATGKIKLKWEEIDGATEYKIYRRVGKSGDYKYYKTTTKTSYTDKDTEPGKVYYYKVKAIHKKDSADSAYSSAVGQTCHLAQPKVEESNVTSSGKIKLEWKKIEGAKEYKIYRRVGKSGDYKYYKTTSSTSYTDKDTTAGKVYYYKVLAVHSNSSANSVQSSGVGQTCKLERPDVSIKLSSGDPKLTWEKIEGAEKYEVYRATSKSGTYKLVKTTTSLKYTDKSATAGKTYYYKVKAVHKTSSANSAYSSIDSIKAK